MNEFQLKVENPQPCYGLVSDIGAFNPVGEGGAWREVVMFLLLCSTGTGVKNDYVILQLLWFCITMLCDWIKKSPIILSTNQK